MNPTFTLNIGYGNTPIKCNMYSATWDLTQGNLISLLDGFTCSAGSGHKLEFDGSALNHIGGYSNTVYYIYTSAESITATGATLLGTIKQGGLFGQSLAFAYAGEKILVPLTLEPKDFIISRNANMYPDNGKKGEYWFQLFGAINSSNALKLSEQIYSEACDLCVDQIKEDILS